MNLTNSNPTSLISRYPYENEFFEKRWSWLESIQKLSGNDHVFWTYSTSYFLYRKCIASGQFPYTLSTFVFINSTQPVSYNYWRDLLSFLTYFSLTNQSPLNKSSLNNTYCLERSEGLLKSRRSNQMRLACSFNVYQLTNLSTIDHMFYKIKIAPDLPFPSIDRRR